jgi:DNA-binding Xre family transcriptional regulator
MREYMQEHHISYYYLANQGIDAQTLQRIRHDRSITTETLGRLCAILHCQPEQLICFQIEAHAEQAEIEKEH